MRWQVSPQVNNEFLDKFPELSPIMATLLFNRGLQTQSAIDQFLSPDYSQDIHDPYLFKDMNKACEVVYQAIKNQDLITVFGDYDADGVPAAVILTTVLERLGAKVEVYLPHREKEGYGLNKLAIEELARSDARRAKTKTKLLITCDCGISNAEEIELANSLGLQVIITDHHAIPVNLPQALAIIHPQVEGETYPFKFLCGGGVAFKLVQALLRHKNCSLEKAEAERQEKWLLDLVAIATVADMVPLTGENRTLVKYGLIVLKKTQRLGLQKMILVAGIDINKLDTTMISFAFAPRINAAGRMDHANLAYHLLNTQDEAKALAWAEELNQANIQRQKITETVFKEAKNQAPDLKAKLLFFYKADWPAGLTGLVASKLVKEFNRPAILLTNSDEETIVGSGRSIEGFHITEALQQNADLLLRFGGHPQACGFSLKKENLASFQANMQALANKQIKDEELEPVLKVELELDLMAINWDLVDTLDKFQPYGQQNTEPLFADYGVLVTGAKKVGKDQNHWKLELVKQNKKLGAIAFSLGKIELSLGQRIDIVYNLNINQWNGTRQIQLIIRDLKISS